MAKMADDTLYDLARRVGVALKAREFMLASAESCTGGWVGQAMTAVAGSSQWYERGFITYTDISKRELLGVNPETLEKFGAVSEPAAREMVFGALANSHAQVALAVSGIAGPDGGTPEKPVGTVCFAWGLKDGAIKSETRQLDGDREQVRRESVEIALRGVLKLLSEQ